MSEDYVNMLSIDGGGIRGIIPSQIIYRIEKDLGINIYNFFDVFTGTSVGSMIIGSIVYGKKSGSDLLKIMENDCKNIMKQSLADSWFYTFLYMPKYDGKEKKRIIEKNVNGKRISETEKKVIIPSYNISSQKTVFFKSWKNEGYVSDIINASSAAPSYFPSVKIGNHHFTDGSITTNNPTDAAYSEILSLYPNKKIRILSIGTGYLLEKINDKSIDNWGEVQWFIKGNIMEILLKGPEQTVDYKMKRFTNALGHEYIRIDSEIKNDSLDDTTDENIMYLKSVGDKLFENNKNSLIRFFNTDKEKQDQSQLSCN